ncbi:MAG: DUF1194 domain-containing protein [Pseudomonadota bacterium]
MRALLGALVLAALAGSVPAGEPVDLELVLMTDASRSIDDTEIRFQREGYATALTDPEVLDAIRFTGRGRIAVAYVEWGDQASQDVVADWAVIEDAASAEAFAAAILAPPRRVRSSNAIGSALMFGQRLIEANAYDGTRRVIDFSADSANSYGGPRIETARDAVLARGTTINGLAVLCRICATGRAVDYDLEAAFERRIVGGPGHFVVTADGAESFARAVRRKLILEISGLAPTRFAAQPTWRAAAASRARAPGRPRSAGHSAP